MQELTDASTNARRGFSHSFLHKGLVPPLNKNALHVVVGKDINERLKIQEIPTVPDKINSAEDLFSLAEQQAHNRWFAASQDYIIPIIRESVSDIEDKPTNENLLKLKNDPDKIKEALEKTDYYDFFDLSKEKPDIWMVLVSAFSQEQLEANRIAAEWVNNISDVDLDQIKMTRDEFRHILRVKSLLQGPVDEAFIKQLEVNKFWADNKIRQTKVKDDGAAYFYGLRQDHSATEIKSYSEVFSDQFDAIAKGLKQIAQETENLIREGKLDDSYDLLAQNARKLIPMYSDRTTDSERIKTYLKELTDFYRLIAKSKCPLILSGMNYAVEGGRVEVGLDILVRTPKTKDFDRRFTFPYGSIATEMARSISPEVEEINPAIHGVASKTASGLYWGTKGVGSSELSFIYTNIIDKSARNEYERTRELFNEPITFDRFMLAQIFTTAHHEQGHAIGNFAGIAKELTMKQYGERNIDFLDELIADHFGVGPYLKLKNDPSQYSPISAEEYVYALLTGNQNDIIGLTENSNSVERMYGLVAKIIISELCLSGAVVLKDGKISIVDPLVGLYRINSLGEEIKKLCKSSNLNPAKVRTFLQKLERGLPKEGDSVKIIELFKASK